MKRTNKKGFTIVELVVVIAVIAILAAVMIPTFSGVAQRAEDAANLADAKTAYTEYVTENIEEDDYQEVTHVLLDGSYYDVADGYEIETTAPAAGTWYLDAADGTAKQV